MRGLYIAALALSLWLLPTFAQAQSASDIPPDLQNLMRRAVRIANTRQPEAMTPFTRGEATKIFDWTRGDTTERWQGGILPIPSAKKGGVPSFLAVFHAWHSCESDGDHVHRVLLTPQGWRLGEEILETDTQGYRIRRHDLHARLDVPGKTAFLKDDVTLERTQADAPPYALIRLSSDFKTTRLSRSAADATPLPYAQVGGVLAVVPPPGKTATFWMEYQGVLNNKGGDYILENEATLISYWYPHIARLPAVARVTATAPNGWIPIAQGDLEKETRAPNGQVTRIYANPIPTTYFTLDMGKYQVTTRRHQGRTLAVYLLNPDATLAQQCLDLLAESLDFCETHFSPYPYKAYTIVQSLGSFGGALEAYSFSTYGPGTLPGTIVHEVAHTWWGGIVPCAYTRSMWNESFANYTEDLFERKTGKRTPEALDPKALANMRRSQGRMYSKVPMVAAYDTGKSSHIAVGYGKGAAVMGVLEREIGQEAMLQCLRKFLAQHRQGEVAEWSDFEAAVKQVTGKDYRWFFAQWAERAGLPALRLDNVRTRNENGQRFVEAEIVQTGAPYRLKLPVTITMAQGDSVTETVLLEGERATIRIPVSDTPTRLVVDPQATVPLSFPPDTPEQSDPLRYEFPSP